VARALRFDRIGADAILVGAQAVGNCIEQPGQFCPPYMAGRVACRDPGGDPQQMDRGAFGVPRLEIGPRQAGQFGAVQFKEIILAPPLTATSVVHQAGWCYTG